MPSTSQRRVPTPLDVSIGRLATPGSSPPSSSAHPPSSPSLPYHHPNTHSPSPSSGNSNGKNGVAVSLQTQLASPRNALEANRLRQEKSRSESGKVMRDVDESRWENAVSTWREAEVSLRSLLPVTVKQNDTDEYYFILYVQLQTPLCARCKVRDLVSVL
ncbi:hypothetical protein BKA70DRAFT_541393 [Coprinopsis sp. MPI-PUGE-AT-0042]|nr:hypothetical protein BKA70DRAFT_541393 [Coprinopsis sp. MPI-PUGE-AT-0042]